jgi:hypothetical protein
MTELQLKLFKHVSQKKQREYEQKRKEWRELHPIIEITKTKNAQ